MPSLDGRPRRLSMSRRLLKAFILLLPVAGVLIYASSALALGIGVTPGKMAFTVRPGSTELQTLYVINQNNSASEFEVYTEGDDGEWCTITPGKFTLDGQERKNVEISVAPPVTASPDEYDLSICIISVPPGSDLRIGAGVKVPALVQITELPVMAVQWWIASLVLILVVLAAGTIILMRRKGKHG